MYSILISVSKSGLHVRMRTQKNACENSHSSGGSTKVTFGNTGSALMIDYQDTRLEDFPMIYHKVKKKNGQKRARTYIAQTKQVTHRNE